MLQRRQDTRNGTSRQRDERGATLILIALVLPAFLLVAGLGLGGAIVRAADDETQRTANLSAAAQAANIPTLGRPTVDCGTDVSCIPDLPNVPEDFPEISPPSIEMPDEFESLLSTVTTDGTATSTTTGITVPSLPDGTVLSGPYAELAACANDIDRQVSDALDVGPVAACGALNGVLGHPWDAGCKVGEAQYLAERARYSDIFKAVPTPVCGDGPETSHIRLRPEMESTGMFRLHQCLVSAVKCVETMGSVSPQHVFSGIGQKLADDVVAGAANAVCPIVVTLADCPLGQALDVGGAPAGTFEQLASLFDSEIAEQTGISKEQWDAVAGPLSSVAGAVFAKPLASGLCDVTTGLNGGGLCDVGVNLASLLPSTFVPRVRAIVNHAIDAPLVPSWANGDDAGDFDFAGHALARRTFKNAIVLPTLPGQLTLPTGASANLCYTGKDVVGPVLELINTLGLGDLTTALGTFLAPYEGAGNLCGAPVVDKAVADAGLCQETTDPAVREVACSMTVDLSTIADTVNPLTDQATQALVDGASALNTVASRAVNEYMAAHLNAVDPVDPPRSADDCDLSPPSAWCIDVAGQQVRDIDDLLNAPSGPSMADIVESAYTNDEPLMVYALGQRIDLCDVVADLCGLLSGLPGIDVDGAITSLPLVIPALDAVPVWVRNFDPANPSATVFEVVQDTTDAAGLYRSVLLDPKAAVYALCPDGEARLTSTGEPCNDLGHTVNLGAVFPTTSSVSLPTVTVPTTLLPTTLPLLTTLLAPVTTLLSPLPTLTPTTLLPGGLL